MSRNREGDDDARMGSPWLRLDQWIDSDTTTTSEYRRHHDGTVSYLRWSDSDAHIEEDEPLRRERFDDPAVALASTLVVNSETTPDETSVELSGTVLELEAILQRSGISEFSFTINDTEYSFDGQHLLDGAIARCHSLYDVEEALRVVWSFHAGSETSAPWVSEAYETIGESNGVYFYIERQDEDGTMTKLGRVTASEAMHKGLAMSKRTPAQRKRLLARDGWL